MNWHNLSIKRVLVSAAKDFRSNDPLRMAGATAFFTTFALPAVLIILIQSFGLFLTPHVMSRELVKSLSDLVGPNTANDLHRTLLNVRRLTRPWYLTAGLFLFLIFVATTLFKVIKDSLDQLWDVRLKDNLGIAPKLINRAKSFVIILLVGLLFSGVLLGEGVLGILQRAMPADWAGSFWMKGLIRQIISAVVVSCWFCFLFKFLPDGRPSWSTAFVGGSFTGILFTLGKLVLGWVLSYSNMQTIYGASTSTVLLMLFVFYCSFIFYYGACFTKGWALETRDPIQPKRHAVTVGAEAS